MKQLCLLAALLLTSCGLSRNLPRNFSMNTQELRGPVRWVVTSHYFFNDTTENREPLYRDSVCFDRSGMISEIHYPGTGEAAVLSHGRNETYMVDGDTPVVFRYRERGNHRTVTTIVPGLPEFEKTEEFRDGKIASASFALSDGACRHWHLHPGWGGWVEKNPRPVRCPAGKKFEKSDQSAERSSLILSASFSPRRARATMVPFSSINTACGMSCTS